MAVNTTHISQKDFTFLRCQSSYRNPHDKCLQVKCNASWSYCGPLLGANSEELPANLQDFSSTVLTDSLCGLLLPFLEFVNGYLTAAGLNHYWLTIRATTPTKEFDKTRWHTDDLFFSPGVGGLRNKCQQHEVRRNSQGNPQTDWKICMTLLGPSTLFIPIEHQYKAREMERSAKRDVSTEHPCTSIRCFVCAATADSVRADLGTRLAGFAHTQASPEECSVFRIGKERGAVHSEPRMSDDKEGRIFVNVVPGREEELRTLMTRWGMEFPRAWWIVG